MKNRKSIEKKSMRWINPARWTMMKREKTEITAAGMGQGLSHTQVPPRLLAGPSLSSAGMAHSCFLRARRAWPAPCKGPVAQSMLQCSRGPGLRAGSRPAYFGGRKGEENQCSRGEMAFSKTKQLVQSGDHGGKWGHA